MFKLLTALAVFIAEVEFAFVEVGDVLVGETLAVVVWVDEETVLGLRVGVVLLGAILICDAVVEPVGEVIEILAALADVLAGFTPALTIVVNVVEVTGDWLVVELPLETALTIFTKLVTMLLLETIEALPPELLDPPLELDPKAKTGAILSVVTVVGAPLLAKLGVVKVGMIIGVILLEFVCGLMAVQGGPMEHPEINNVPLTMLRL